MIHCYILSRPLDIDVAQLCAQHMASHGWQAHIVIDPREWQDPPLDLLQANYSTMGAGMYGNDCASAILDTIILHSSPGSRVVKSDCDVWLSHAAAEWLAEPGPARAMNIHHRRWMQWGGVWAADREHVIAGREHASTLARCECPESFLNLTCLHATDPGCQAPAQNIITQWTGGERGYAATLPIHDHHNRQALATALFDT
jgi:hypothetical protein